ncbi:hypothetical protein J2Z44_000720 [Clostridium punense]|uniref:Uncharacterized protein n=1 Tax=Clostridium punense TaxID=1054297 RepID=A0ABS4JZH4_9CLOT|nr:MULTISPECIES: hypothetical protein [Clostridium]EQB88110.1 hypothetical protein M918_05605 [Clostridium sp. BL8]MBP2020936.1 hypothetical protein [Clostridium punense]
MYIALGNTVVDSKEMKETIENNTDFKVIKDMSKGTKREDILAFNLSVDIETLKEILKEDYELEDVEEDELFEEFISLTEEMTIDIEDFIPENAILQSKAYKWDADDTIKLVIAMADEEMGELKLKDIMKRLLTQVE